MIDRRKAVLLAIANLVCSFLPPAINISLSPPHIFMRRDRCTHIFLHVPSSAPTCSIAVLSQTPAVLSQTPVRRRPPLGTHSASGVSTSLLALCATHNLTRASIWRNHSHATVMRKLPSMNEVQLVYLHRTGRALGTWAPDVLGTRQGRAAEAHSESAEQARGN